MWDNFIIPAPRFSGSTGIRRHYTLHPSTLLSEIWLALTIKRGGSKSKS